METVGSVFAAFLASSAQFLDASSLAFALVAEVAAAVLLFSASPALVAAVEALPAAAVA